MMIVAGRFGFVMCFFFRCCRLLFRLSCVVDQARCGSGLSSGFSGWVALCKRNVILIIWNFHQHSHFKVKPINVYAVTLHFKISFSYVQWRSLLDVTTMLPLLQALITTAFSYKLCLHIASSRQYAIERSSLTYASRYAVTGIGIPTSIQ